MAKRLIIQKRGKGGSSYTAPSHKYFGRLAYPQVREHMYGEVVDIVNSVGHSAPLMIVELENSAMHLMPAPLGTRVGQKIEFGSGKVAENSIMRIKDVPAGTFICNIEAKPGDRGKLLRAAGAFAQVIGKEGKRIVVKMPSRKKKEFNPDCLVTVGRISGSGRNAKPLTKAGNAFHKRKAQNRLFPIVKGVAMNVCNHPHGGTHRRNLGRPTAIKRGVPAGRKSGSIGARRMGRTKK